MKYLQVKNWNKFQHYKDRCPPWIKLQTDTFQNYDFSSMQDASKLLAICIWTLAARTKDGFVPNDLNWIMQQCSLKNILPENLKELIDHEFISVASEMIADCKQSACPETEGEREAETEQRHKNGFLKKSGVKNAKPITGTSEAERLAEKFRSAQTLDA